MERKAFNDDYPIAQIGMTILVSLASFLAFFLLALILAVPIFGISSGTLFEATNFSDPKYIPLLKYIQIVQSTSLFVIPPMVLGKIFLGNFTSYLHIDKSPGWKEAGMVVLLMIFSIPAINFLSEINSMIRFPEAFSSLERYLQSAEKEAESITELFLKVNSFQGLMINLLMIGIIPAIGEEFFFRGLLQRIFSNWFKSVHWGIIVSAFLFSAIHMQFYGFIPRFLLGALLGYLFVWSGSLWLPILAHFVNNAVAVICYYLINIKLLDEKFVNLGSGSYLFPITLLCFVISAVLIQRLYQKKAAV